ncbi:MAG: DUF512 domain-containing protein [Oscillospiraceae bacterium]|jgi:putative radical SAM enzyme (TIGR03279 family)|nr:DUF512 domain-containing protein [Oscillospiraceae bacterium]
MNPVAVKITGVAPRSPAERHGLKSGWTLLAINGNPIRDVLDYRFYSTARELALSLEDESGSALEIRVKKREYADLGLEFESWLMSPRESCRNNCVFCFVDQLPKGLRGSLYFKDDDSRLSFLQGNYITLTNLSEKDADRIIKMRTAVNVSVHTTDPSLRVKMMGNPNSGRALDTLYRFAKAGVQMNCQLVLCREINDGARLTRTLDDLTALEAVRSVACVPAGLTRFRARLPVLRPYDAKGARAVVAATERYERVYAADEFYLIAGLPLPEYGYYGDFPQYENGVGMCAYLKRGFAKAAAGRGAFAAAGRKVSVVTGTAAFGMIKELVGERANVFAVKNEFFGESVTVSGLLTGGDIIRQLRGRDIGGELLIGANTLNADGKFLDDVTPAEAGAALGAKIRAVAVDGGELFKAIAGG